MASGAREWVSVCVSYFAQTKWKYWACPSFILHEYFFFLLKNKMSIFCRLNGDQNGGAWCSASPVSRDLGSKEYIEGNSSAQSSSLQIYSNLHKFTHFALIFSVDLGSMHCITGAMTQGRFGNGRGVEFTEAYKLQYWRPGMSDFVLYHDSMGRSVSFCL